MAFSLEDIKQGGEVKPPRILLLGVEKIGKTTFACGSQFVDGKLARIGINSPIVVPIREEDGADGLGVPMFPRCSTYEDVISTIASLYEGDHDRLTYVLDSVSSLAPLITDTVCGEFQVENIRKVPGFRTGEASVVNKWRELLAGLDGLREQKNMSSILIGHVKVRKHKNPEGDDWDTYDLDVEHPEVTELLRRWADLILFASNKVVVKKDGEDKQFAKAKRRGIDSTGKRYLFTQKRPGHPGGGRNVYGRLPYEIPLDWAEFEAAVAAAASGKTTQQQEEE